MMVPRDRKVLGITLCTNKTVDKNKYLDVEYGHWAGMHQPWEYDPESLEILWPDGTVMHLKDLPADTANKLLFVHQGRGFRFEDLSEGALHQ